MRENRFREGEVCKVRGCEFPVFWTEEQLCRDHVMKRDLAPDPGDDPFAKVGHVEEPPSPALARAKPTTPKE